MVRYGKKCFYFAYVRGEVACGGEVRLFSEKQPMWKEIFGQNQNKSPLR